jgi:S-adenosylmethionine hydrolase
MKAPAVFFLSDFGADSVYLCACRALFIRISPNIPLIDITHSIPPYNITAASLILEDIAPYFPPHSVIVAVVDPTVGSNRRIIAVKNQTLTFIAPDNGLLSPFLDNATVFSVTNTSLFNQTVSSTFHARDIMVPVAAHIASGMPLKTVGAPITDAVRIAIPKPSIKKGRIKGEVISADRFGNLITNIKEENIIKAFKTNDLKKLSEEVRIYIGMNRIEKFFRCYADAPLAQPFGTIGSFGRLEISVREGSAQEALKAEPGTSVTLFSLRKQ